MVGRPPRPPGGGGWRGLRAVCSASEGRSVPFTDLPSEGNLTYATASGQ
jgi:hypothetical protein